MKKSSIKNIIDFSGCFWPGTKNEIRHNLESNIDNKMYEKSIILVMERGNKVKASDITA